MNVFNTMFLILIPTKIFFLLFITILVYVYLKSKGNLKKNDYFKKRINDLDESKIRIDKMLAQKKTFNALNTKPDIVNNSNVEEILDNIIIDSDVSVKDFPSKTEKRAKQLINKNKK